MGTLGGIEAPVLTGSHDQQRRRRQADIMARRRGRSRPLTKQGNDAIYHGRFEYHGAMVAASMRLAGTGPPP